MTKQPENDRRKTEYSNVEHPFYFKPVFTLSTILAIIAGGLTVVMYITDLNTRLAVIEVKHDGLLARHDRDSAEVQKSLDSIDAKLDELLEKFYNGRAKR